MRTSARHWLRCLLALVGEPTSDPTTGAFFYEQPPQKVQHGLRFARQISVKH
jgi:hypothetical protein